MSLSTSCEKCVFSKTANSDKSCEFNIIDAIKDSKKIDIKNNYYHINNYVCKYGFSKNSEQKLLTDFPETNLLEYAKYHAYINYYLVINNMDNPNGILEICNNLNDLTIKPKGISILTRQDDLPDIIRKVEKILGESSLWRLHNFFDPDIDFAVGLNTVMSTNNYFKKCDFLWTINDTQLKDMIQNKAIEQINYIVNVLQPDIGIMQSKLTKDYLSGIFLTKQNYNGLTTHIAQLLNVAIKTYTETENINISLYDD
jgi:hypothetical protein